MINPVIRSESGLSEVLDQSDTSAENRKNITWAGWADCAPEDAKANLWIGAKMMILPFQTTIGRMMACRPGCLHR